MKCSCTRLARGALIVDIDAGLGIAGNRMYSKQHTIVKLDWSDQARTSDAEEGEEALAATVLFFSFSMRGETGASGRGFVLHKEFYLNFIIMAFGAINIRVWRMGCWGLSFRVGIYMYVGAGAGMELYRLKIQLIDGIN